MATEVQVSTSLSFDSATTNIFELGHPALITISNSQNIDGVVAALHRDCRIHCSSECTCEPHLSLLTANVTGKKTGHKACLDVAVTLLGKGVQLVKFEPKVSDDYSLSVCYKGQHLQGSPFTIKIVEKEALDGHWNSKPLPGPVVSVGEPVNLIIPEGAWGSHIKEQGIRC